MNTNTGLSCSGPAVLSLVLFGFTLPRVSGRRGWRLSSQPCLARAPGGRGRGRELGVCVELSVTARSPGSRPGGGGFSPLLPPEQKED